MSSQTSEGDTPQVGTNAFDFVQSREPQDEEAAQPEMDSTKWTRVTTSKMAQSVAKRMYRALPKWQLTSSMDLLCDNPPHLLGAAKITRIHFTTPEVANVATCALTELMGGVVEVMRASATSATSAAAAAAAQLGKNSNHLFLSRTKGLASTLVIQRDKIDLGWMLGHPLLKEQPPLV